MMVWALAGAFMTISMHQSHGEPIAAMSHEIEIAGSGSPNCGPLMANQSFTYFCCANTNDDHCYAAAC